MADLDLISDDFAVPEKRQGDAEVPHAVRRGERLHQRVLVAFDGSPRSWDALALALRLLDPTRGSLILACVRAPLRPWHLAHRVAPSADPEDEGTVEMLQEARRVLPSGIPVETRTVVSASPARGLTELAEQAAADLVVLGSGARAASGRIATERTAGRLLQGAPCAVAVAPADATDSGGFNHLGIAYDGSREANAALAAGYAIAARDGAAVTLFRTLSTVRTGGDDVVAKSREDAGRLARLQAQAELDAAAEGAPKGVNPQTVLLYGDPGSAIAEASEGIVDLMVTGSRAYGPMQRALLGSVSAALVDGAGHPVLVLPR